MCVQMRLNGLLYIALPEVRIALIRPTSPLPGRLGFGGVI